MVKVMESPCVFLLLPSKTWWNLGFSLFFWSKHKGVHLFFSSGDHLGPSPHVFKDQKMIGNYTKLLLPGPVSIKNSWCKFEHSEFFKKRSVASTHFWVRGNCGASLHWTKHRYLFRPERRIADPAVFKVVGRRCVAKWTQRHGKKVIFETKTGRVNKFDNETGLFENLMRNLIHHKTKSLNFEVSDFLPKTLVSGGSKAFSFGAAISGWLIARGWGWTAMGHVGRCGCFIERSTHDLKDMWC